VQRCGRYKMCSTDPVFPTIIRKIHRNPQNSYLVGRGFNSGLPEFKEVVITREQLKVSVTSCNLPTFRRTGLLNDITLYQPYKLTTDVGSSVISSNLKHRANDAQDGSSSYSNRRDQSGLTAVVLQCGKQMEKLPHYHFSWIVCFQNRDLTYANRTMWRNRFGRGFGPVVRQNTEFSLVVKLLKKCRVR
jgi:hypothetical protein